ncbi:MAG: Crp/Fnr family transcriptional regulator [Hungatella hathewayi]|jgi:CRP/FNR family transcriptional regulator|nr:Crp/Fnr family transcriptional regulator [Hungatella hathewayi]RHB60122.1 Crp/Fnr family transcriptional regulator [Hungatella hathewayi]
MNLVSHSIRGVDDQNNAIHKRGKWKMESSAACLNELRDLGTLTRKKKNDCLYNRAHLDKYVYCLEEGLCALHSVSPGGRERIYQYFLPGDFVGFIPAYARSYPDDTFYAFSITAKSACLLYQIPYNTFREYVESHPDFYRWLFETAIAHYDNALKHCYALQDGDNFVSLCYALTELAVCEGPHYVIHKDFSYSELANYLGIHTITVTRIMGKLKDMGVVSKRGHQTVIHDMARLTALAQQRTISKK